MKERRVKFMGFDFPQAHKKSATKSTTITVWGEPLNVKYVPQQMTPRLLSALMGISNAPSDETADPFAASLAGVEVLLESFLGVVVEWDVVSDGVPVPLTREALEDVPLDLVSDILAAIREEQSPNAPSGTV